jgi:excisionase family DNA binding protein
VADPTLRLSRNRQELPHLGTTEEQLLSIPRVAEWLSLSEDGVRRRIRSGELPVVCLSARQRRIRRSDLEAFLDAHTVTQNEVEPAGNRLDRKDGDDAASRLPD